MAKAAEENAKYENELRRAAPAKPGEQYGAPGNGSSMGLSVGTAIE